MCARPPRRDCWLHNRCKLCISVLTTILQNDLAPLDLLELSTPALRYLRAFTAQCYQPAAGAAISQFDNSWAVALVTIWNDLTSPENGV